MKNRLEFVLCSGFLFLGGLIMFIMFEHYEFLEALSIIFCWMGGLGLLASYSSCFFSWYKKRPVSFTDDSEKEDSHADS